MLLQIGAKHQNIIQVNCHEMIQSISKCFMYQTLECSRSIAQTYWKDFPLKQASWGDKYSFEMICRGDFTLMVCICQISLAENSSFVNVIQEVINMR